MIYGVERGDGRYSGSEGVRKLCQGFLVIWKGNVEFLSREVLGIFEEKSWQTRTFAFAGLNRYRRSYYTRGRSGVCIIVGKCEESRGWNRRIVARQIRSDQAWCATGVGSFTYIFRRGQYRQQ